jgi:hypothetical protein
VQVESPLMADFLRCPENMESLNMEMRRGRDLASRAFSTKRRETIDDISTRPCGFADETGSVRHVPADRLFDVIDDGDAKDFFGNARPAFLSAVPAISSWGMLIHEVGHRRDR